MWISYLIRDIFGKLPFQIMFSVAMVLAAQVLVLVATLLPLKILLLVGSGGIPGYFPDFMKVYELHVLIIILSVVSIAAFFLYLIFEKVSQAIVTDVSSKLVGLSNKVMVFENQDLIARASVKKIVSGLAGLVFTLFGLSFLLYLYPLLVVIFVTFFTLYLLFFWLISKSLNSGHALIEGALKHIANSCFLVVFIALIYDFLYLNPPSFLLALISLIIFRQIGSKAASTLNDTRYIHKNKGKLQPLFLKNIVFLPFEDKNEAEFSKLFEPESLKVWLPKFFRAINVSGTLKIGTLRWLQSGVTGVVAVRIASSEGKIYLMKLFNTNRKAQALHESLLVFSESGRTLPCPKLINVADIGGYQSHLFELDSESIDVVRSESSTYISEIWRRLIAFCPSEELRSQYSNSHAFIWQRFRPEHIKKLIVAAKKREIDQISLFQKRLSSLCEILSKLPFVIINKNINFRSLLVYPEGSVQAFHWGAWSMDTVGVGLGTTPGSFKLLEEGILYASQYRAEFSGVNVRDVKIAAYMSQLEVSMKSEKYLDGIEAIIAINSMLLDDGANI